MLKAHQACIDLKKGVLRIQDREVGFLPEHELPDNARVMDAGAYVDEPGSSSAPVPPPTGPGNPSTGRSQQPFTGSGRTLGATPAAGPSESRQPPPSQYPEKDIRLLMDLGVSREVAISTLQAAGGNVDVAASLLF
jgi:DNA damage-inducible protein 1